MVGRGTAAGGRDSLEGLAGRTSYRVAERVARSDSGGTTCDNDLCRPAQASPGRLGPGERRLAPTPRRRRVGQESDLCLLRHRRSLLADGDRPGDVQHWRAHSLEWPLGCVGRIHSRRSFDRALLDIVSRAPSPWRAVLGSRRRTHVGSVNGARQRPNAGREFATQGRTACNRSNRSSRHSSSRAMPPPQPKLQSMSHPSRSKPRAMSLLAPKHRAMSLLAPKHRATAPLRPELQSRSLPRPKFRAMSPSLLRHGASDGPEQPQFTPLPPELQLQAMPPPQPKLPLLRHGASDGPTPVCVVRAAKVPRRKASVMRYWCCCTSFSA